MSSSAFPVLTVAACILLQALAENATTCSCGWINAETANIIGGDDVTEQYPFVATVYRKVGWQKEPICGATIITSSKVITAAHCVDETFSYFVLAGVTDISKADPSNFIAVTNVATYGFNKNSNVNDIAIITLSTLLNFESRKIGPVCLPSLELKQYVLPNIVRILGWAKAANKLFGKLQRVDSNVVNIRDCLREYPQINEEKQFCTYDAEKGPIKGDSGGPVLWWDPEIMSYTLIGIVSMGPQKECSIPVVHTFVPFKPYLEFINAQTDGKICTKI